MKITPSIIQHEFVGKEVKIFRSSNPSHLGLKGRIIDETRNTFGIIDREKEKTIPKKTSIFHFRMDDGTTIEIDGKILIGRPEERLKKKRKRW